MDHTDFIRRHHPSAAMARRRPRFFIPSWLIMTLAVVYIAVCAGLAFFLQFDPRTIGVLVAAFIGAFVLAFITVRFMRIQSRLDKERLLLREVIEGSRGARLVTDAAEQTVLMNDRLLALFPNENVPTLEHLVRLFEVDHAAGHAFSTLADQARRGLTDSLTLPLRRGDHQIWWTITAQPVAGWSGYVHWRIDDVTDQYDRERVVREEREKLIDFTDNAPVGFFSLNEQGRFLFVNATLARWLGESIENLLDHGSLHPFLMDVPADMAAFDIMKGGGARQSAEWRMRGAQGRVFQAAITQTVVSYDGRVRTRGVINDVTAEREVRKALAASEDRFRSFFDNAPLGIALIDKDFRIADGNFALAHLLRIPVAELMGRNFIDMIDPDGRGGVVDLLGNLKAGSPVEHREVKLLGVDTVAAQMFARALPEQAEYVIHFLDLTAQKNLEAQFVQSQKMQAVGQLAGGIAHDFNNLLTAMIGYCDLLLLRHKPGDPSFSDVMQVNQNANRAANLVRQLLAFSRQQTLRPDVHDVTDILTELSHLMRRLLGVSIDLTVTHGTDKGFIKVDIGQIEQVLINLVVNARDAMPQGGKLRIETDRLSLENPRICGGDQIPAGSWVVIRVADTGTGIPPDIISRIFEPFFTTKGVGQGTGLGLATVYGIMRQSGGYIDVESVPGEGTCFSLFLPQVDAEERQAINARTDTQTQTVKDLTGTARVLLVEDEDAVRSFSQRALVNKGYDVMVAENGQVALTLLADNPTPPIDLLITDVMMPEMDGPTLVRHVRAQRPDLRIIFMSGYTEERLKEYMGPGIYFLAKPFSLKVLAEKVREVLDQPSST